MAWMEEYKRCHCTVVARIKRDLLGYCPRHLEDRMHKPIRVPDEWPTGYAGNG